MDIKVHCDLACAHCGAALLNDPADAFTHPVAGCQGSGKIYEIQFRITERVGGPYEATDPSGKSLGSGYLVKTLT